MTTVVVIGGYAPSLILFRKPLLEDFTSRGHRVIALAASPAPAITQQLAELGVAFEPLALDRTGLNPLADASVIAHLVGTLRRIAPDVVFAYTFKPVIYGLLAARAAGVPRRYAMITGLGYSFAGQDRWQRRLLRRGVSAALRATLSTATGVFFQNPDDLADLRAARAIGATPSHLVRGSGVDVDHYTAQPFPDGPPTFLYVGRLLREKGFEDFVEMARRVRRSRPDVRFVAVGWIDPNPASVAAAEVARWVEEGILEYPGEVADVRPHLARCHVLVLPSYREGTPRSVLEAMATGRPVIVTDVPGCRETIVDGQHGMMVPVRDPAALAAAAEQLLADPERMRAMGRRARDRVERLYDARQVAAQMTEVMRL